MEPTVHARKQSTFLALNRQGQDTEEDAGVGLYSCSSCARLMGCVLPPLVNILDQIVLDELHLLLRIMDVLIRNLILYADSIDHRQRVHHGIENQSLRKLE